MVVKPSGISKFRDQAQVQVVPKKFRLPVAPRQDGPVLGPTGLRMLSQPLPLQQLQQDVAVEQPCSQTTSAMM
jgi:hypothetical protein